MRYVIVIELRTSLVKVVLFNDKYSIIDKVTRPLTISYPKDGWAEIDAEACYSNVVGAISQLNIPDSVDADISIAISNQRESSVVWDKRDGKPIHKAITWQCCRGYKYCRELIDNGYEKSIKESTGLQLDTCFSASGLRWLLDNVASVRERAERGDLLFGTMDTWLIWKLTKGVSHVTDYSNASRTLLFNINTLDWDESSMKLFTVPPSMMPEARPSDSVFGYTNVEGLLSKDIPIAGVVGDSNATLIAGGCFEEGLGKASYGNGTSIMFNIGEKPIVAPNGMVCSIGYSLFDKVCYVVEGHSIASGKTLEWLNSNLYFDISVENLNREAKRVTDNGGVYFVPAFSGLGSPWWLPDAKAMICGLTLQTKREHLVRAAFESIAYQVTDVVELLTRYIDRPISSLFVDGSLSNYDFLIQFQADMLGIPIKRHISDETSCYGAALLNGCAVGIYNSIEQIEGLFMKPQVFQPIMKPEERNIYHQGWLQSVHTILMSSKR